ncbi:hypothetical protein OHA70_37665 [Kribbella sp. NBC_00382]|uniref:hypothetical protein n=1 Tax=Kribbella sp. NBC_00382 TaxID=2975967 RepID=UPI002E22B4FA
MLTQHNSQPDDLCQELVVVLQQIAKSPCSSSLPLTASCTQPIRSLSMSYG